MPDAPTLAPPAQALKDFMGQIAADLPNPQIGTPANIPPKDKLVEPGDPPPEPAPVPAKPATPEPTPQKPEPGKPEPVEDKWPRSAAEWKNYKAKYAEKEKGWEEERKALQAQLDEAKKTTVTPVTDTPEYKAVAQEREALSERLKIVDVTQHPKFQQYFSSKKEQQLSVAKSIVGADKADAIAKILDLPDGEYKESQLNDFVSELSPLSQARIGSVVNSLTLLENERQSEIKKSQENFKQMQDSEAKKANEQKQALFTAVETVLSAAQDAKKGHPSFQKREGQEEWNKAVDTRIQTVKSLFSGKGSADMILRLIVAGTGSQPVLEENLSLREQLTKAEEQIKALSAAQPRPQSQNTQTSTTEPKKPEIKPGSTPRQTMGAWVGALPSLEG